MPPIQRGQGRKAVRTVNIKQNSTTNRLEQDLPQLSATST